jgi:hypothetical protein
MGVYIRVCESYCYDCSEGLPSLQGMYADVICLHISIMRLYLMCGSGHDHHEDTCLKEIGLHLQISLTTP